MRAILAGLALVATTVPARAAEPLPAVRLAGSSGVRQLCERVRSESLVRFAGDEVQRGRARAEHRQQREAALAAFYSVDVPAAGFGFREFDYEEGRLAVETRRNFAFPEAGVELYVPPSEGDDDELSVALDAGPATAIVQGRKAGKVSLRLYFRLDAGEGGDPCLRLYGGRTVKVRLEVLAFELVQAGQVVARGETENYASAAEAAAPVRGPRVRVSRPTTAGARDAPADVAEAARGFESALAGCYQKGLAGNPRLRGVLVVGLTLDRDGKVESARIEINSLDSPPVEGCVLERMRAKLFPKPSVAPMHVSVPLSFGSAGE